LSKFVTTVLAAHLTGAVLVAPATGNVYRESWQRSYVDPSRSKIIKVAYYTSPSYRLDHASVYFHDDRVAITLWQQPPSGTPVTSAVVRCAAVRMGEPLRGRRRIDGKTHRHPPPADPSIRRFKLKRAHCPKPGVVRHHLE
jgi:hypothetical protein